MGHGTHDAGINLARARMSVLAPSRIAREALCQLIGSLGFVVIGAGASVSDLLWNTHSGGPPDLIVGNIAMGAEAGTVLADIRDARARVPELKTVLLIDGGQPDACATAMMAGVDAVLSTEISADVLRRSLELVLLGQRVLPADAAPVCREAVVPAGVCWSRSEPAAAVPVMDPCAMPWRHAGLLSRREQEIMRCLVDGMSNKMIARTLDITEATVKVHIKGVLRKTRLGNRTQVAIWALSNNFRNGSPLVEADLPLQASSTTSKPMLLDVEPTGTQPGHLNGVVPRPS